MSRSLAEINKSNGNFYGDKNFENWQPGERPIVEGPGAMLTSPMQAQEEDDPTESNMPSQTQITNMGEGQNPHSYLEPKNEDPLYRPNMGLVISPHDKSITEAGYAAPSVAGTFGEDPSGTLASVNAKNKEYWQPDLNFEGEPTSLNEGYPLHGPQVEPDNYGRNS